MVEIKIGKIEESSDIPSISNYIKSTFATFRLNANFDSVYACQPHLQYSEDFLPEQRSATQLELYIFAYNKDMPEFLRHRSIAYLHLKGKTFELPCQDALVLSPGALIPEDYECIQDEQSITFALKRENQVWLLFDMFHNTDRSHEELFKAVLEEIWLHCALPSLTPEQKEAKLRQNLIKNLLRKSKTDYEWLRQKLEENRRTTESYQLNYQDNLKNFLMYQTLFDSAEELVGKSAEKCVDDLATLPFVSEVKLEGDKICVYTKKISVGPLNFGKWKLVLNTSPEIVHLDATGVMHPYQFYLDKTNYCLGGFTEAFTRALHEHRYAESAMMLRHLITNYSYSTKMHLLEPYLRGVMGAASYEKLVKQLYELSEISEEKFDLKISQISGKEVTVCGTRKLGVANNEPQTIKKVLTF